MYYFNYFTFSQCFFVKHTFHKVHPNNSAFASQYTLSSSPWWLHCVPVMWNGIPTGGLQESGVLHWEHWNRCCHELDHEPYGWPRCAEQREFTRKQMINQSDCPNHSSCSPLSDWLQTSQPPWCCQAAAPAPGPRPQRAFPRSTWQPSFPWASAETRQPKHFEPRSESDCFQLETGILSKSRTVPAQTQLLPFRSDSNVAKFLSCLETLTSVGLKTSTKMSCRILIKVALS